MPPYDEYCTGRSIDITSLAQVGPTHCISHALYTHVMYVPRR